MTPRIAVCDYGVGNLRSVERAIVAAGGEPDVTGEAGRIGECDALVLPGVGAFGAAVDALAVTGLRQVVLDVARSGRPVLGVCLGFQLLFDESEESGGRRGLGLLPGRVERLHPARGKVPHMGWNQLRLRRRSSLLEGVDDGAHMYFVHSYAAIAADPADAVAVCDYGGDVLAVCERGNVWGTQFHPEKSGRDGIRVYANLVRAVALRGAVA